MSKQPVTYTAPHAVYVDETLHPAGEPFVTTSEPGAKWERISKGEKAAADASSKLVNTQPDLESLDLSALKALAATKNVESKGLSKADLVTAIKAVDEPAL